MTGPSRGSLRIGASRVAVIVAAAILGRSVTPFVIAPYIPGREFDGMSRSKWWAWSLDPSHVAVVALAVIMLYVMTYFVSRRLELLALLLWSVLMGGYITAFIVLDLFGRIDKIPVPRLIGAWLDSWPGVILQALFAVVLAPALVAFLLYAAGRIYSRRRPEQTAA